MTEHTQLPDTVVGIDLETTALTPEEGDIIEVAAIRYDLKPNSTDSSPATSPLGREVDQLTRLTKPTQPLTAQIIAITGITQDMVANKPSFSAIRDELAEFIGDSMLFAHNAPFDIGFLAYHGLQLAKNPVWDTFPLASIAWPEAESYNLGMLADQLGLNIVGEHRAGDDVRLTWQLLNNIYSKLTISSNYYQYVTELLRKSGQSHYRCLFTSGDNLATKGTDNTPNQQVSKEDTKAAPQLNNDLSAVLGPDGYLAQKVPNFAYRPEQIKMAQEVERLIREEKTGFIEAGTGTGKTYAYLIPLLHACTQPTQNKKPGVAIVSTHTKNLQDQLIEHDIPKLAAALHIKIRAAVLKGRRNYLCISRLLQVMRRDQLKHEDAMLLIKLLVWLEQGGKGDLDRLNASHQAQHLLRHLHADALSCRLICPQQYPDCPYQRARQQARQADLVVVNHALLVQLGADEALLPVNHLIIDEAHHLEQVARDASRVDLSEHRVAELIAPFIQLAKSYSLTQKQHITTEVNHLIDDYHNYLQHLTDYLNEHIPGRELRLTSALRRSTSWQKILQIGAQWRGRLQFLLGLLRSVDNLPAKDTALLLEAIKEAEKFSLEFEIFQSGSTERIQWLEKNHDLASSEKSPSRPTRKPGYASLHDVALSVESLLTSLFLKASSVTLTSATLTTNGNFDYVKHRLGLSSAHELKLGSSFDYKKQMLIYLVEDGKPKSLAFDDYSASQIEQIAKLLSGRVISLFTSHKSVRYVYGKIIKQLHKAKIKLLAQKVTGGRHNIAKRFQRDDASVLLGTYSFWEGIDIPGESLSCVVIPKLPFMPPSDPVLESLAESEQVNAFQNFSLPQMILRLRQGVGRLIRSESDRGAVVIFDSRILDADYGSQVLASLPPAKIHIGPTVELIPALTDWFGRKNIKRWTTQLSNNDS